MANTRMKKQKSTQTLDCKPRSGNRAHLLEEKVQSKVQFSCAKPSQSGKRFTDCASAVMTPSFLFSTVSFAFPFKTTSSPIFLFLFFFIRIITFATHHS